MVLIYFSKLNNKKKWVESQKSQKEKQKIFKFRVYSNARQKYIRSVPNSVNLISPISTSCISQSLFLCNINNEFVSKIVCVLQDTESKITIDASKDISINSWCLSYYINKMI